MSVFILAATPLSAVMACPQHDLSQSLMKRADGAANWGMISESRSFLPTSNKLHSRPIPFSDPIPDISFSDYTTCQTGTQKSPIHLTTAGGFTKTHTPNFNYSTSTAGSIYNWGYGAAFSLTPTPPTLAATHP